MDERPWLPHAGGLECALGKAGPGGDCQAFYCRAFSGKSRKITGKSLTVH